MNAPSPQLSIAARGWQHPGWCGSYYPDDLPEDWRLDYFANEFRQVLLPFEDWSVLGLDDIDQWVDATDEGFRFFVELPANGMTAHALDRLQALGPKLAGICMDDVASGADPVAELARLTPLYGRQPLAAVAPFAAASQWLPLDDRAGWNTRLVVAAGDTAHSALQLRAYAQALLTSGEGWAETLVVFEGEPPQVEDMRMLQQLGELLSS